MSAITSAASVRSVTSRLALEIAAAIVDAASNSVAKAYWPAKSVRTAVSIDGSEKSMVCSDKVTTPPNVFLVTCTSSTSIVRADRPVSSVPWLPTSVWIEILGRINTLPAPGMARGPSADTMGRSARMSS